MAIANSKRIDRLFISPYSTGACGIYEGEPTKSIEIKCITLKEFMQKKNIKKIDLLKMDCEGAEYEIIESLSLEDLFKIKRIVMEVHHLEYDPSKNHIWLKDYLKKRGYEVSEKINKLNGNYYLFAKKKIKK